MDLQKLLSTMDNNKATAPRLGIVEEHVNEMEGLQLSPALHTRALVFILSRVHNLVVLP